MKSPYSSVGYDIEDSDPVSPPTLWERFKFRELALCFLSFHLGFACFYFLSLYEEDIPVQVRVEKIKEDYSLERLVQMVESMPENDFRACLQLVIGTEYEDRCKGLLIYLTPYLYYLMSDKDNGDEEASPSTPSTEEENKKSRRRKRSKKLKQTNPGNSHFIIQICPAL